MEQTQHWSELFERTAMGYTTAYDQLSEQVKPNIQILLAYTSGLRKPGVSTPG